jgi:hypothetical protein
VRPAASPARVEATASRLGGTAKRWSGPSRAGRRRLRQARRIGRDVVDGVLGVAVMVAALLTPFDRRRRRRWGMGQIDIDRAYPGDDLVDQPRWGWTHGIEVAAPADQVWPWVAQIGADRGGFYSYESLENLVGCGVRNADVVHPEWAVGTNGELSLHPKVPRLRVAEAVPGRHFVAHADPSLDALAQREPWTAVSWLFLVEPLGPDRCRVVSRYRCATSDDRPTRLRFGPTLVEPISFAMDRRMLQGIKARAEAFLPRAVDPSPTHDPPEPPRRLPLTVRRDWGELATPTRDPEPFEPGVVDRLPSPVALWVRHAVAPGAPLRRTVLLTMHGEIRTGRWQPFSAVQVLAPPDGFVWAATAGRWPLRIQGFDRYSHATGEMRWRLGGVIPVSSAVGADITRSAAGRLAAELVLVPAAALDPAVSWQAIDERHAAAAVRIGDLVHHLTIDVDDRGALRSLWLPRWGNPEGGGFAEQPFGVEFADEAPFDGYAIPTTLLAGWGYGTNTWPDGGFFRATIDAARYR